MNNESNLLRTQKSGVVCKPTIWKSCAPDKSASCCGGEKTHRCCYNDFLGRILFAKKTESFALSWIGVSFVVQSAALELERRADGSCTNCDARKESSSLLYRFKPMCFKLCFKLCFEMLHHPSFQSQLYAQAYQPDYVILRTISILKIPTRSSCWRGEFKRLAQWTGVVMETASRKFYVLSLQLSSTYDCSVTQGSYRRYRMLTLSFCKASFFLEQKCL